MSISSLPHFFLCGCADHALEDRNASTDLGWITYQPCSASIMKHAWSGVDNFPSALGTSGSSQAVFGCPKKALTGARGLFCMGTPHILFCPYFTYYHIYPTTYPNVSNGYIWASLMTFYYTNFRIDTYCSFWVGEKCNKQTDRRKRPCNCLLISSAQKTNRISFLFFSGKRRRKEELRLRSARKEDLKVYHQNFTVLILASY